MSQTSRKTKRPTNSFGHFLKEKRVNAGNRKINFDSACKEWNAMSDEGKDFYKQLFEAEKVKLVNTESCSEDDIHNNPGSNLGASSSVRLLKQMDNSVLSSVMKFDDLDQVVAELQCEKEKKMETVFSEKLQVSQLQYIVNEKSSEIKSFNDKYNTILLQHSACQDDSTS